MDELYDSIFLVDKYRDDEPCGYNPAWEDEELNETGYYPLCALEQDVEKAWQEYELHQEIEALEREMALRKTERSFQLERIAKEAFSRKTSLQTIFKFFAEYGLSECEKTEFWQYYYFPE